jgi:chromosome segregation ATPase
VGTRVQVLNKCTAQHLSAARAEADRLKAALQAAENQLSLKDERIAALHYDMHLLDAQKDELKHAFVDASGAVASAADNSSALEARTRALQAQLRDRDEAEAVMKEQLSSLWVGTPAVWYSVLTCNRDMLDLISSGI